MTNSDIADIFKLTSQLMELHGENEFKVKGLAGASFRIDKIEVELHSITKEEVEKVEGINKTNAAKIEELRHNPTTKELDLLFAKTPLGVVEMLNIKGIGPKKVAALWKQLEIESPGELLYACNENRLIELKGFGEKTQDLIKKNIEFINSNKGKLHFSKAEKIGNLIVEFINANFQIKHVSFTGELRRKCEIVNSIEILISSHASIDLSGFETEYGIKIIIISCDENDFFKQLFLTTGNADFINKIALEIPENCESEEQLFLSNNIQFIEPELREGLQEIELAKAHKIPQLIQLENLKGVLHNHSKYSDGVNTLEEMSVYCKLLGYEYFGICDHSQTAVYAGGLPVEKVLQQHKEIDLLNQKLAPFKVFKGIESDILGDGSLDYPDVILAQFDFIVASVHSNLKMSLEKATTRVLAAVENPYTTILGHPTGRFLLSREGYPLDHKLIIDACAKNNVVIELNAHPYRLDLDWRWIQYAVENGVKISINPDAHKREGFHDMYYGICAARKGMLTNEMCFNSLSLAEIDEYFIARKSKIAK